MATIWLDDENDDDAALDRPAHRMRSASVASTSTMLNEPLEEELYISSEGEEEDGGDDVLFAGEVIDLTKDDAELRTQCQRPNERQLSSVWTPCGTHIKPDNFIQVKDTFLGDLKIHFVRVSTVIRSRDGRTLIRGIPYTWLSNLNGKIRDRPNEVCMILHFHRHSDSDPNAPILVDVEPRCFIRWRNLVTTNAPFPMYAVDRARWKLTLIYSIHGSRNKAEQELIEHLRGPDVSDADDKYRASDESTSHAWRGERRRGGAWNMQPHLQKPLNTPIIRHPDQAYTLFDSFCGAGGVSRGAENAGFKIRYAIDKEPECAISEYVAVGRRPRPVDVLHLSPPCQVWSPAHTRSGKDDAENTAALYACRGLIEQVRPRIITLEQTFGITQRRHVNHLWALVRDFTDLGYSVRWSVVRLSAWGSAQDRKRLIMIASAPGERLPPLPAATHSESGRIPGTRPFNTIGSTIARVRRGDDLHNLHSVRRFTPRRAPYSADRLGGTITTGGSSSHHPSGLRGFTLRELACLQGFPKTHRFRGTSTRIRRQIGNAFPPNTVTVLYRHLHEWLLREDNARACVAEQRVGDGGGLIEIEDDSESSAVESVIFDEVRVSPAMEDVVMEDVVVVDADDDVFLVRDGHNCFVDLTL